MSSRKVSCSIMLKQADKSDPLTSYSRASISVLRYPNNRDTETIPVSLTMSASAVVAEGDRDGSDAAGRAIASIFAYLMDHRHDI